ncbi:MAG: acyl-CoA thioesterase [Thermoanaerobacteraceae bacterium]|nr:acyl-CoA thioesterase [Thermoanaerobacteraceae bacterium]
MTAVELRVRYQETDQMGVVYHSNYLVWCEIGRTELLRKMGISYREIEAMDIYLPVTEVNCRYKSPARYDDVVVVETRISNVTGVRLDFTYQIVRKEDNVLLAEAATHHAFVDGSGRPVNIKKKAPRLWEIIQKPV